MQTDQLKLKAISDTWVDFMETTSQLKIMIEIQNKEDKLEQLSPFLFQFEEENDKTDKRLSGA